MIKCAAEPIALSLCITVRSAARSGGFLLLAFGIAMTLGTGVKSAFDASVFAASAGAFLLTTAPKYAWSIDEAIRCVRHKDT